MRRYLVTYDSIIARWSTLAVSTGYTRAIPKREYIRSFTLLHSGSELDDEVVMLVEVPVELLELLANTLDCRSHFSESKLWTCQPSLTCSSYPESVPYPEIGAQHRKATRPLLVGPCETS